MKGTTLAVVLTNGETVHIPALPTEILTAIFAAHAAHLEEASTKQERPRPLPSGNLLMQALAGEEQSRIPSPFWLYNSRWNGGSFTARSQPSQRTSFARRSFK